MTYQSFYELQRRNRFVNKLVIFVPVVVEGDRIAIVFINAGRCDGRASKVSANVLGYDGRIAEALTFLKESPICSCISFRRAV